MRRRTPLTLTLAALVVAGVAATIGVVTWSGSGGAGAPTWREYAPGERPAAPAIGGTTLDGDQLAVADLHGEVVVVNVWGSWCGPCRAEMADLEEVHQRTADLGVSFVGVNIRDERDRAVSFAASRVTYPSIYDRGSSYALAFRDPPAPIGPPATLVIDRAGDLAAYFYRVVGVEELEQVVTEIAAEDGPG